MRSSRLAIAVLAAACSLPLAAQEMPATVSAADPEGMIQVPRFAGYSAGRYVAVRLDDEGDPWVHRDIVTGSGDEIPASVS